MLVELEEDSIKTSRWLRSQRVVRRILGRYSFTAIPLVVLSVVNENNSVAYQNRINSFMFQLSKRRIGV